MRPPLRLFLAAAASFSLAAAAQQPPAESPGSHWYGYEIMLADAASLGMILVGAKMSDGSSNDTAARVIGWTGVAGLLAGSPLIHALGHRQYGRAVWSFVIRDAPLIGALALTTSCHGDYDNCAGEAWGATLLGLVSAVGIVIDWTALAREPAEPARVTVVPLVGKQKGAALALRF